MAWILSLRRAKRETGRLEIYYSLAWREEGRVISRALGFVTAAEARKALRIVEGRLAEGRSPSPERPRGVEPSSTVPTVTDFFKEVWLLQVQRDCAPRTYAQARSSANNVIRHLGDLPLDRVDYCAVDVFVTARRREGVRTRTVQLDVRALKQGLRHAHRMGLLPHMPEMPLVRITDAKPHVWYSEDECRRLLAAAVPPASQPEVTRGRPPKRFDPLSYVAISMALNLGMRRAEILSRGWEDIHWSRGRHGVIVVAAKPAADFQVKTRRSRAIPLTPEVHEVLHTEHQRVGRPASGWIFPSPSDPSRPRQSFRHALDRACDRAGLRRIHVHGLRHSWASRLAMAGVDRRSLMELGGWTTGQMLDEIYAHVSDDHVADIMSRVGIEPGVADTGTDDGGGAE